MSRLRPTDAVFLNVPFDTAYRPLFEAMVFAVLDCGFQPRCALETTDAGQVRVQKIAAIIRECALGIHDISRTGLDKESRLPRFNVPFELGLFLGAKWFGNQIQRRKKHAHPGLRAIPLPTVSLGHRRAGHQGAPKQTGDVDQGRAQLAAGHATNPPHALGRCHCCALPPIPPRASRLVSSAKT